MGACGRIRRKRGERLMSGGHFNYLDSSLKNEMFGWSDKFHNVLDDRELSELVWDILDLLHDYDWYISGDTGEDSWIGARKEFKDKWLNAERKDMVKRMIDDAVEECRKELYRTYDVEGRDGE